MFFSGGHDLKFNTWTPEAGLESSPVQVPSLKAKLLEVSLSYDNSFAAVLRENEKPMIYAIKEKSKIRLIQLVNLPDIVCLTFKRNTKRILALGTSSGEIILYDTKLRNAFLRTKKQENLKIRSLDYTCDDQQLCGINEGVLLILPEINQKKPKIEKQELPLPTTTFGCHPFNPNLVVVGCVNGCAMIWDIKSNSQTLRVELFEVPVVSLKICKSFLVAAGGKSLIISGLEQGTNESAYQFNFEQDNDVQCMDISADNSCIGLGLSDGSIKLCDLKDQMKTVLVNPLHDKSLCKLVFMHKPKKNATYSICDKASFTVINEDVKPAELNVKPTELDVKPTELDVKPTELQECEVMPPPEAEKSTGDSLELGSEHISTSVSDNEKADKSKSQREKSLEIMKARLLQVIKSEIVYLNIQLEEHCSKFQNFLNSDFETINDIIKKKWDIFSGKNINQILEFISCDSKELLR